MLKSIFGVFGVIRDTFAGLSLKTLKKKVHICFFGDESESKETLILSVTHVVEKVAEKVSLKGASSEYLKKSILIMIECMLIIPLLVIFMCGSWHEGYSSRCRTNQVKTLIQN